MKRAVLFKMRKILQRLLYGAVSLLVLLAMIAAITSSKAAATEGTSNSPDWITPATPVLQRIGNISPVQHEPYVLSNLNCTSLTYRMSGSSTMRSGCFTQTAFGSVDSDNPVAIFNGTDEGSSMLAYSPGEVLVPWPNALDLLALDATDTGGSYLNMYKDPLAVMQDLHNAAGAVTTKQLKAPPEVHFLEPAGHRLVVNPQTIAFSGTGDWLIVETLSGQFVRISLSSLAVTAFAPSFARMNGTSALLKSQVAVSDDGRYVAIENDSATSLKVYDLNTCAGSGWQTSNCAAHDYWSLVHQQVGGIQRIRHVRFLNDDRLSFEVTATASSQTGVYDLAPTGTLDPLINYLGLGDSYTSGEGAFDYLAGTDTPDNNCHLSIHSYPLLLSHDLFSAGGHSVACSGAVINDVDSTSQTYRGQVKNGSTLQELVNTDPARLQMIMSSYQPGEVPQSLFMKQYQPGIATVSIGGNDIGFGDILQNCVEPHLSLSPSGNTCYSSYESRKELLQLIDRTKPRWTALYKQLQAEAPKTRLYAIGYPKIVSDTGECGLNVHLNQSERAFANELESYLNSAIQQAAAAAGVPYVDISQALVGHRLCEVADSAVAVNGLTAGNDTRVLGVGVLGRESYHPNALGQALIEEAVLQQTRNFSDVAAVTSPPADSARLLSAPKTGRPITALIPDDNITTELVPSNGNATLRIDGVSDGLRPNSPYTVRLDGSDGTALTTLSSNNDGNVAGNLTVPSTTARGGHTLDITGTNQAGEQIDVSEPIYVASAGDADSDKLPDGADSCPYAANSTKDNDHDGIDDACDGFIGTGASDGSSNGASSGNSKSSEPPIFSGSSSSDLPTRSQSNSLKAPGAVGILHGQPSRLVIRTNAQASQLPPAGANIAGTKTINPTSNKMPKPASTTHYWLFLAPLVLFSAVFIVPNYIQRMIRPPDITTS